MTNPSFKPLLHALLDHQERRMADKITPCSADLHDWQDEQRARDLVENLEQWADQNLGDLFGLGELARVRRICTKWLNEAS